MIEKTISNTHYDLGYDLDANRLYLRIKGFWKRPEDVPNFVTDVTDIGERLQPGFTVLSDVRTMKTPPVELNPVHEAAQKALTSRGLSRTAEIWTQKDTVLRSVTEKIASQSGMRRKEFNTMKEAEAWLDVPEN